MKELAVAVYLGNKDKDGIRHKSSRWETETVIFNGFKSTPSELFVSPPAQAFASSIGVLLLIYLNGPR